MNVPKITKILENSGIYSELDRKSKTCFFAFLKCVYFLNRRRQIPNLTAFVFKILGILQTRMGQRGDPMKMNFDNFQMKK